MAGTCSYKPDEQDPPEQLCTDGVSDMTIVASHGGEGGGNEPVVYAVDPNSGQLCTGDEVEIGAQFGGAYEGWVCLAVRGEDNVGNRGVSAPIAVCLDDPTQEGTPDCWDQGPEQAPSCSDGCTPIQFADEGVIYRKR